jgi:hypothetical protein
MPGSGREATLLPVARWAPMPQSASAIPRSGYERPGSGLLLLLDRFDDPDALNVLEVRVLELADLDNAELVQVARRDERSPGFRMPGGSAVLNIAGSAGERSGNSRT